MNAIFAPKTAFAVGLVVAVFLQGSQAAEIVSEKDKVLYALGLSFARSAFPFDLTQAELELVKQGLVDGVALKSQIDSSQYLPRVSELARERLAHTFEEQRQAGQLFLSRAATRPGALRTHSGLVIEHLTIGRGRALEVTDKVLLSVRGVRIDGTEIQAGQNPVTVVVAESLPCWSEALLLMRVGGRSRLTCPPELTYRGLNGPFLTKAGATLIFEVEVQELVALQDRKIQDR